jgi:hypothetical protein
MWRGSGIDPRQVGGQDLSPKAEFKWPVGTRKPLPATNVRPDAWIQR